MTVTPPHPLLAELTPAQRQAVLLTTALLDCFNGQGMLDGVSRYATLEGRLRLAAARSRDLGGFYSVLARSLRLPQPSAEQQAALLPLLTEGVDAAGVLRCLATETPYAVMLARALHTEGRDTRKADREARRAEREWAAQPEPGSHAPPPAPAPDPDPDPFNLFAAPEAQP